MSMFNTLNRFIARLDSDPNVQQQGQNNATNTGNPYGFQVLANPNAQLPLEPWFDFIIGINGRTIEDPTPALLATEIRNCAGTSISLGIYSAKGQQIRETFVSVPSDTGSLGLSLQWCPLRVTEDVWHILDVMPNSPADVAGLLPYGDYVIGSPEQTLRGGEGALGELVESFMDSPLRLWVYNQEYNVTRIVTMTPARGWGGEGALGCVLGYGALHRVPAPLEEPAQGPGETLFESGEQAPSTTAGGQQELLVPANMTAATASTPPPPMGAAGATMPPSGGKPKKQRAHANAPVAGLDDYFAEGEQKSKEMEGGSSSKPNAGLPPPPKGGPPKATSPAPEAVSS